MNSKNEKKNTFVAENAAGLLEDTKKRPNFHLIHPRRDARVAEEARLESVYTPKGYPGFESPSLRVDDTLKRNRKKQQ